MPHNRQQRGEVFNLSKALDNFTEGIKHLIQTAIDKAPFDKTYKGRVLSVVGDKYTVLINNKEYPNTPAQGGGSFNVDDLVRVVFPQNNANLRYIANEGAGGGSGSAVLYTPQILTEAQKAQARTNIGAGTGGGATPYVQGETLVYESGASVVGETLIV